MIGATAFHRLRRQLEQLLFWTKSLVSEPPQALAQRVEALSRLVPRRKAEQNKVDKEEWLNKLFQANSRVAHRFCNQPKKPSPWDLLLTARWMLKLT